MERTVIGTVESKATSYIFLRGHSRRNKTGRSRKEITVPHGRKKLLLHQAIRAAWRPHCTPNFWKNEKAILKRSRKKGLQLAPKSTKPT